LSVENEEIDYDPMDGMFEKDPSWSIIVNWELVPKNTWLAVNLSNCETPIPPIYTLAYHAQIPQDKLESRYQRVKLKRNTDKDNIKRTGSRSGLGWGNCTWAMCYVENAATETEFPYLKEVTFHHPSLKEISALKEKANQRLAKQRRNKRRKCVSVDKYLVECGRELRENEEIELEGRNIREEEEVDSGELTESENDEETYDSINEDVLNECVSLFRNLSEIDKMSLVKYIVLGNAILSSKEKNELLKILVRKKSNNIIAKEEIDAEVDLYVLHLLQKKKDREQLTNRKGFLSYVKDGAYIFSTSADDLILELTARCPRTFDLFSNTIGGAKIGSRSYLDPTTKRKKNIGILNAFETLLRVKYAGPRGKQYSSLFEVTTKAALVRRASGLSRQGQDFDSMSCISPSTSSLARLEDAVCEDYKEAYVKLVTSIVEDDGAIQQQTDNFNPIKTLPYALAERTSSSLSTLTQISSRYTRKFLEPNLF
jgi:hypothetical protein